MKSSYSESGINWGFEIESIILEIIGDGYEISLDVLLDLLLQRMELQTLFANFAEFLQSTPEISLTDGTPNPYQNHTIKDELQELIYDLTTGAFHMNQYMGLQKLHQNVKIIGNKELVYIQRIGNVNNYI